MRNHVRHSRSVRTSSAAAEGHGRDLVLAPAPVLAAEDTDLSDLSDLSDGYDFAEEPYTDEGGADEEGADEEGADLADVVRLSCPDCGRPIAVAGDDSVLPSHAVCPNPWQPFGLTVCAGSGRAVADAGSLEPLVVAPSGEQFTAALPLDWRTQPFSHVGGPGSRPIRVPLQRDAHPLAA